jgi:YVTN family beta-propeller protein
MPNVSVIDGATDRVIATVTPTWGPLAFCYNSVNNKVYCAGWGDSGTDSVRAIDGTSNLITATVPVGDYPSALCHNPRNNKVYCANRGGYSRPPDTTVTVIDGATNQVLRTIGVGAGPFAFAWNPMQNRVYVANSYTSSISVLRDSGGGIEEVANDGGRRASDGASVVRCLPPGAVAFDAMGRRVTRARAGVYFVREEPQASGQKPQAVRKVVVQH